MKIQTGKNTGVQFFQTGRKVKGVSAELIETAAANTIVQGREQFIIEHNNGSRATCDLKCLNFIVNELHESVKVLANSYQEFRGAPVHVSWQA